MSGDRDGSPRAVYEARLEAATERAVTATRGRTVFEVADLALVAEAGAWAVVVEALDALAADGESDAGAPRGSSLGGLGERSRATSVRRDELRRLLAKARLQLGPSAESGDDEDDEERWVLGVWIREGARLLGAAGGAAESGAATEDDGPLPSDRALVSFRRGELSAFAAAEVAVLVRRSARAREALTLLLALGGGATNTRRDEHRGDARRAQLEPDEAQGPSRAEDDARAPDRSAGARRPLRLAADDEGSLRDPRDGVLVLRGSLSRAAGPAIEFELFAFDEALALYCEPAVVVVFRGWRGGPTSDDPAQLARDVAGRRPGYLELRTRRGDALLLEVDGAPWELVLPD